MTINLLFLSAYVFGILKIPRYIGSQTLEINEVELSHIDGCDS